MTAVVIRNPRGPGAPPAPPSRADGGEYRFEMLFDGLKYRGYADTVTELCEQLIAGYSEIDGQVAQAAARILYAVGVQVHLQAELTLDDETLEQCTPAEQEVLLGSRHVPPEIDVWEADIPLVLVDVYYEPLGPLPRPTGRPRSGGEADSNLIWLRPADEAELLTSLAEIGVITLGERLPAR
jgi:hypothetical protein